MKNLGIILTFLGFCLGCVQGTQSPQRGYFLEGRDTINGIPMEAIYYYQDSPSKDTDVLCIYGNGKLIDSLRFEPRKHGNHTFNIHVSFLKEDSNQLKVSYTNVVLGIDSTFMNGKDSAIMEGS